MMKNEIKGLIMEIESHHCIIMTHEGEFHRVGKPSGQVEVGQEITARINKRGNWLRPLALAASLVLMVTAGWSVYQWNLPAVAAYVSLDINPSIELGVDRKSKVVEAEALNEDGEKLLQVTPVTGKDIYTAMSELVTAAVEQQYITEQKDNLVFTAIELEPKAPAQVVKEEKLYQAINKSLHSVKQPVSVQVTEAQPEARQEAHKLGVSTGRYLLIEEAVKEDKSVKPQDLVNKNLAELGAKQWIEKMQQQKAGSKTSWQIQQPSVFWPQWTLPQSSGDNKVQPPAVWPQWKNDSKVQPPAAWPQWNGDNKVQPTTVWPQWNGDSKVQPPTGWHQGNGDSKVQPLTPWPQWNGDSKVQPPTTSWPQWRTDSKVQPPTAWPQWNGGNKVQPLTPWPQWNGGNKVQPPTAWPQWNGDNKAQQTKWNGGIQEPAEDKSKTEGKNSASKERSNDKNKSKQNSRR